MLKLTLLLFISFSVFAEGCLQLLVMSFEDNSSIHDIDKYNECKRNLRDGIDREIFCSNCIKDIDLQSKVYQLGKRNRSKDHKAVQKTFEKNLHQAILDEFKKSTLKNMRSVLLLNQDIDWLSQAKGFKG